MREIYCSDLIGDNNPACTYKRVEERRKKQRDEENKSKHRANRHGTKKKLHITLTCTMYNVHIRHSHIE